MDTCVSSVNKTRIKVQHVVGEGLAQVDVVREIELPAVARKVYDVDAEIVELDYEIIPNKIIIKGALHKQIYYVEDGDFVVKEYTIMREEFTDFVHIPGAKPDMEAMLDANIVYINMSAADGEFPTDTLNQSAVLSVSAKVYEIVQLDVVTDVAGKNLKVEKDIYQVDSVVGENCKQVTVSSEHRLKDPARKIYDMDAVCRDVEAEILPGKVIIKGTLHKQVYYVDEEDDTVQEQSFDDDFSVVLDVPDADPEMDVYIKCKVEFCEASLIKEKKIKTNCILYVFAKVTELKELNLVTDVIGAIVDKRRIRVEDIIGKCCRQENVNQSILVKEDDNEVLVKKARDLHAKLRNFTFEKICNKVIVKGNIHVQAYYISCEGEQELRETSAEVPFTTFVHFDGVTQDTMIEVRARVEYTDLKLEGDSCETSKLRAIAIIEMCVRAYEMRDIIVVTDVIGDPCVEEPVVPEQPIMPPEPEKPEPEVCPDTGFYTYTVQPGDTLAKIAMEYQDRVPGITWRDIYKANPGIDPNNLKVGQTIKIPCVIGMG